MFALHIVVVRAYLLFNSRPLVWTRRLFPRPCIATIPLKHNAAQVGGVKDLERAININKETYDFLATAGAAPAPSRRSVSLHMNQVVGPIDFFSMVLASGNPAPVLFIKSWKITRFPAVS